jgi:hypothetical protein
MLQIKNEIKKILSDLIDSILDEQLNKSQHNVLSNRTTDVDGKTIKIVVERRANDENIYIAIKKRKI